MLKLSKSQISTLKMARDNHNQLNFIHATRVKTLVKKGLLTEHWELTDRGLSELKLIESTPKPVRMYNTIRTDTLESKIASAIARKDYCAVEVWREVAKRVNAPIRESEITLLTEIIEKELLPKEN